MEMFFVLLHLWILAWMCTPSHAKNVPLVMEATEPTAVMEGSEFDKAFAVVNAMFEQITETPGHSSGRDLISNEGGASEDNADTSDRSKDTSAPTEGIAPNQYYIKAKDSDFILIDPLNDDDRNAAALSKMVLGSYQNRRREAEENHVPEPVAVSSPESGEDHEVAATEDSKEQEDDPVHQEEEGDGEDDQEEQGDQGSDDEDEDSPVQNYRTTDRDSREADDDEEEDEEDGVAPLEGAPVTEEDLDDFAPETFMPPTVLGVARHYKVGSSFSVFPVHIPNAPEHIELGSGVPAEDEDEDATPREEEEEVTPTEDQEEDEDMEPHATTSSRRVFIEPPNSEDEDEEEPTSSKKGHRVSEHGDDESHWKGEGGDQEAEDVEHDIHGDEVDEEEDAENLKESAEISVGSKGEGGDKKSESLLEALDQGIHQDDSAGEEEEATEEQDKHGKKKMEKGFHDKYNFDQRVSRNRFYKHRRDKGDWITSGKDELSFYKNTEGDEVGSYGKYNQSMGNAGVNGGKQGGQTTKKKDSWKKSKSSGKKEEGTSEYEKGKNYKSGREHYSWE